MLKYTEVYNLWFPGKADAKQRPVIFRMSVGKERPGAHEIQVTVWTDDGGKIERHDLAVPPGSDVVINVALDMEDRYQKARGNPDWLSLFDVLGEE